MHYQGDYGGGYIPDTHDKSKDLTIRHLLGGSRGSPGAFTMEQFVGLAGIKDQKQTSACTGFAFARTVHVRLAQVGTPIEWPSEVNIYTVGRAVDRSSADVALVDEGAMPNQIVRGMQEWGIAPESKWPFDPDTINDEPDLLELEEAALFTLDGVYRIDSDGQQRLDDIRQAISEGYPIGIGVEVDQAFEDYAGGKDPGKLITAPDESNLLGGHMLCLVGYEGGIFRGVNSWGTGWGDGGMFWTDESWIVAPTTMDIYAITASALHPGGTRRPERTAP